MRRQLVLLIAVVVSVAVAVPTGPVAADPDGGPAQPHVSNMGLCSPFLASLGVRAEVNHLLKEIGPYLPDGPFNSPGELYRIRAGEHPDASAATECVQR